MEQGKMLNPKRTIWIAVSPAIFFATSWFLQRDKTKTIQKEKEAQQEEGVYQDIIIKNVKNIEVREPLKKLMDAKSKAFSKDSLDPLINWNSLINMTL